MKTTYKLIGLIWDGAPLSKEEPSVFYEVCSSPGIGSPETLFDDEEKIRSISLSRLMAIEDVCELDTILSQAESCSKLEIVYDYKPRTKSTVVQAFFKRKVCQVYAYVSSRLPGVNIRMINLPAEYEVSRCD